MAIHVSNFFLLWLSWLWSDYESCVCVCVFWGWSNRLIIFLDFIDPIDRMKMMRYDINIVNANVGGHMIDRKLSNERKNDQMMMNIKKRTKEWKKKLSFIDPIIIILIIVKLTTSECIKTTHEKRIISRATYNDDDGIKICK